MGTVVDFVSRRSSASSISSKEDSSSGPDSFEEQTSSKEWLSDTVMLALAQSYVRKAAELTRRVKGSDDAVAWMLEDMSELLVKPEESTNSAEIASS